MSVDFSIDGYHRPRGLAQAVEILSNYGRQARVIAGGSDILPRRPGISGKTEKNVLLERLSSRELKYLQKRDSRLAPLKNGGMQSKSRSHN